MNAIIIDTHIFLWLIEGNNNLNSAEIKLINKVLNNGQVFISVISIWEIAMLQKLKKISLSIPLNDWITKSLGYKGITLSEINIATLIESVNLPESFHKDPADRIIVATSRIKKIPILTHDSRIINYGKDGNVQLI